MFNADGNVCQNKMGTVVAIRLVEAVLQAMVILQAVIVLETVSQAIVILKNKRPKIWKSVLPVTTRKTLLMPAILLLDP